jgi:hypothetical protein
VCLPPQEAAAIKEGTVRRGAYLPSDALNCVRFCCPPAEDGAMLTMFELLGERLLNFKEPKLPSSSFPSSARLGRDRHFINKRAEALATSAPNATVMRRRARCVV